MTRRRDRRRHTAVHEAGHAVIGRVLMQACGPVTIKANRAEMEAGHAIIADPWATVEWWDRIGRYREGDAHRSAMLGRVITHMAGAESEVALLGACQGGDGEDRRQVAFMVDGIVGGDRDQAERLEARLRQFTRQLVRCHVGKIEALARALWAAGTIADEGEVRAAAGLSPAPTECEAWQAMAAAETVEAVRIVGTPTPH